MEVETVLTLPAVDVAITASQALKAETQESAIGAFPDTWQSCVSQVLDILAEHPHACVIKNAGFTELPVLQRSRYVKAVAALFGPVSDNNRFDAHSNVFVDEVKPSDPESRDVTFTLGACEAHSDESSKLLPEDVVLLWCVRPAHDGGVSTVWPASELEGFVRERPDGAHLAEALREPVYPFGGRLRKPPRVLQAPILFGSDGIRFRLGSLQDGVEIAKCRLSPVHTQALTELVNGIESIEPFSAALETHDLLVMLNRRVLHGRTDFTDQNRLLLRTRCFNKALSNSRHDHAQWLS